MLHIAHHLTIRREIQVKKITLMAIACLMFAACGSDEAPVKDENTVADSELTGNTGRVLSVIPVQNYTYVEVRNNGRNVWLAGTPVKLAEGDIVSWNGSMVMQDFHSKALDRTFEEILFVSAINMGAGGGAPVAQAAPDAHAAPVAQAAPDANTGTVLSTVDAAGYTYVELETESGQVVWLAAPNTEIAVGDHVAWLGGATMTDFTSTTLNKTFPEILFVQNVRVTD